MDLGTKTANDLLSRDFSVAIKACDLLINQKDTESFRKLTDASEFIFPFLKEKINKNLLSRVNIDNYKNLFDFMKIYSSDYEDFIVGGLVKFASQELTDDIYEIFENGSVEEKTYCAAYFSCINDEIALDLLNKYAMSDDDDLAQNCARALSVFNDREIYNKSVDVIKNTSPDDFIDNIKYVNFLINYGDKRCLPLLFEYAKASPVSTCILPDLLGLVSYFELINDSEIDTAVKIYLENLDSYPEILSLSTLEEFEILDFIKYIFDNNKSDPLMSLAILKTKTCFDIFVSDEAYKIELSKNEKEYINKIFNLLYSKDDDFYDFHKNNLKNLFSNQDSRIISEVFGVIGDLQLKQYFDSIFSFIQNTNNETLVCEGIKAVKSLNMLDCVNKDDIISKIKNENIKAIILNYFD